jgi:hypothetical protein
MTELTPVVPAAHIYAVCIMVPRSEFLSHAVLELSKSLPASIKMPCGNVFSLDDISKLPKTDTPCPCGDPSHWLVKYIIGESNG